MEYASIAVGIVLLFIVNKFILAPIRRLAINTVIGLFMLYIINSYGSIVGLHHVDVNPLVGLVIGFVGVPGVIIVTLFYTFV